MVGWWICRDRGSAARRLSNRLGKSKCWRFVLVFLKGNRILIRRLIDHVTMRAGVRPPLTADLPHIAARRRPGHARRRLRRAGDHGSRSLENRHLMPRNVEKVATR